MTTFTRSDNFFLNRRVVLGWHPDRYYAGGIGTEELLSFYAKYQITVPAELLWPITYGAIIYLRYGYNPRRHLGNQEGIYERACIWMHANHWDVSLIQGSVTGRDGLAYPSYSFPRIRRRPNRHCYQKPTLIPLPPKLVRPCL